MVNVPGRSRGCATCRKRKVKCDESIPECLRCLNMGLRCPGARAGAFFVHAVTRSKSLSCLSPDAPHQYTTASLPLPGPQPPRATAFDQLFVSHFIESFFGAAKPPPMPGAPPKIWLHELPALLASPEQPLAQHAIRATCMLSYGSVADDASIKIEARNWYTKALQGLQYLLSSANISFSEGAVCTIVMLMHFETWAGTSQKAWLQHVKGAVMLLEAGGPERCRSGFMHQVFTHLRLQAFITATAENVVSVFASEKWMTVPFETYPKLIFDKLADLLFTIQRCLALADQIIRATGDGVCRMMETLDTLVHAAMSQIRLWWIEYTSNIGFGQTTVPTCSSVPDESLQCDSTPMLLPYSSIPTAALTSLFDTANIMAFRLLHLVSPSAIEHDPRIRQHCQSILSANQFIHETSGPAPDRGSTMMAFQLKVVSLWSSSTQQREVAVTMLHGDKVQGGGLADISAVSREYFADVAAHILKHHPCE